MPNNEETYQLVADLFIENDGRPPSSRETMKALGAVSTSTASLRLRALEGLGFLSRFNYEKGEVRNIRLAGAVAFAVPRNVRAGNLYTITEPNVFVDQHILDAKRVYEELVEKGFKVGWFQQAFDAGYATRLLHPEQVAVVSDRSKTIFKAVAFGAAVYRPEHVTGEVELYRRQAELRHIVSERYGLNIEKCYLVQAFTMNLQFLDDSQVAHNMQLTPVDSATFKAISHALVTGEKHIIAFMLKEEEL